MSVIAWSPCVNWRLGVSINTLKTLANNGARGGRKKKNNAENGAGESNGI